jgi:hypothetical protein
MSTFSAEQRTHILGREIDTSSSPIVSVHSGFLATEHWVDLVSATAIDSCEYGYAVGIDRQGEPVLSDRLEGYPPIVGKDGIEIEDGSLPVPMFPFGVLQARKISKAVLVHTHPMPTSENHPRTRIFSDKDIGHFLGSDYSAMMMLDQGGAHLLAKKERFTRNARDLLHPKLVETTLLEIREGSRSMRDVLSRVAYQLWVHDVGYYYTPDLSQPKDTVEFQNLRQAKAVLTPSA